MKYNQAPAHIRAAINQQAARWTTTDGTPLSSILRQCRCTRGCTRTATVYAMGPGAGDWADWYHETHVPAGFTITDRIGQ